MFGTILERLLTGLCAAALLGAPGCAAPAQPPVAEQAPSSASRPSETERTLPDAITVGTQTQRGFINDNVYHSELGDIHYSSYIPDGYNGSEPYALFITLPGWEGLYFQGVGPIWWRTSAPRLSSKTTK